MEGWKLAQTSLVEVTTRMIADLKLVKGGAYGRLEACTNLLGRSDNQDDEPDLLTGSSKVCWIA